MTAGELIKRLAGFPAGREVVVHGVEEGWDPVDAVREIALVREFDPEWYVGQYAENDLGDLFVAIGSSRQNGFFD